MWQCLPSQLVYLHPSHAQQWYACITSLLTFFHYLKKSIIISNVTMSLFWWRKWINAIIIIIKKWKIKEINLVTKWLHWGELKHDHHFLEKGAHQANKLKRDETEIWDSPLELLEQKSKLIPSLHGFMLGVCSTGALTGLAVCLCLCVCVWRFCSVSVHRGRVLSVTENR